MRRFAVRAPLVVSLLASLLMIGAPLASAATPGGGQALEIAPPILTLSANPGQTLKIPIKLRDVSSGKLAVTNQINDFVAAGEDGTPKILTDTKQTSPFSLKDWISPLAPFTLSPQQIQTVNVTITVPKNASPGGHYGVIRFTGRAPQLNSTGVSLSASLGALVLLTVSGKLHEQLSLQELSANKNGKTGSLFQSAPVDFTVRLKNTGNVQEQPSGYILVTDMFGKTVAAININQPPRYVLPDSIRKFTGELGKSNIGNKRLFGRYHAKLTLTYGANKQTLTGSMTFWVIPYKLIAIVIILLIAAFFVLRYLLRRYNQSIVRRAQGTPPARSKRPKK